MIADNAAPIAVLGAGSWGTALAIQLARAGQSVRLWSFERDQVELMQTSRENARYLPGIKLPDSISVTNDIQESLNGCRDILIVVPSHAFSETILKIKPLLTEHNRLVWGTKGLDSQTGYLLHQVVQSQLGNQFSMAVISGPSFAKEVAQGLPTAITIAGNNDTFNQEFAHAIHSENFRPYTNNDFIGVQIAGAMKNPIAVAAGIADGMGMGANARCALITRGLVEITRLGMALGAQKETFSGLAGMGDLILTCTDNLSRNRRFGLALGEGESVDDALKQVGQVVEGKENALLIKALADKNKIAVPIVEQVCSVVTGELSAQEAARHLLQRDLKSE